MAENGGLMPDDGPSPPLAKKVCTGEASSSAQPVPIQQPEPDARFDGIPDITFNAAEASSMPQMSLNGPHQWLRRKRGIVGVVDYTLVRDTITLVTIMFPDNLAEHHRSKIVNRVRLGLRASQFLHSGLVPHFESSAGETLRLPRRSYACHILQLLTRDDTRDSAAAHY
ncbi:unnamed protein product [Closterium sp. NIES-65]|nr:unnamed protein product [Closterium sp. NIES-65]